MALQLAKLKRGDPRRLACVAHHDRPRRIGMVRTEKNIFFFKKKKKKKLFPLRETLRAVSSPGTKTPMTFP